MMQNNDEIKFIKANIKHVDIIYDLEKETLPKDMYSRNAIIDNIKNKSKLNIIEKNKKNYTGYACLSYFDTEGELLKISIKKEYQNKGYGFSLLNKIISEAKLKGIEKVFLEVRETNNIAISFYKKFGFKIISTRKEYYSDGTNATIMEYYIK